MRKKTTKTESLKPKRWPWVLLIVAGLLSAYVRIRLLNIPLERDEGEFAYMGQLMLQGIPPYKIAFNMKMPGIYAAYALIMAVFGQSIAGIHVGFLLVNLASIVLLFLLTRKLFGLAAGACAAAAYSLLAVSPSVLGTSAHATHFVVLFALAGMLLILKAEETRNKWIYLLSGLMFGVSFLMKQPGGLFGLGAFAYAARREFVSRSSWTAATTRLGALVVGGILPLAATVGLLWNAGVLTEFYFWTVTYLREYATRVPLARGAALFWKNGGRVVADTWPLYVAAAIGLLVVFLHDQWKNRAVFSTGLLVTSFLVVCPGLYFRAHYFVVLLPAVALLAGAAAAWGMENVRGKGKSIAPALACIVLFASGLILPISRQGAFFFSMSPERACREMYGGNPFPESIEIARYIRSRTTKNDQIAVLGSEPQIYFYSQRLGAISYIYMYPLMEEHPFAREMQLRLIKQIETSRPKYIVFTGTPASWGKTPKSDLTLYEWLPDYGEAHYTVVGLAESLDENFVAYYWDADVEGRTPRTNVYISVFKRKEP